MQRTRVPPATSRRHASCGPAIPPHSDTRRGLDHGESTSPRTPYEPPRSFRRLHLVRGRWSRGTWGQELVEAGTTRRSCVSARSGWPPRCGRIIPRTGQRSARWPRSWASGQRRRCVSGPARPRWTPGRGRVRRAWRVHRACSSAALATGCLAVTVPERGGAQPGLERLLVPPARDHQPGGALVGGLEQLEGLESWLVVHGTRTGGEPAGELVAAIWRNGDCVDLHDGHAADHVSPGPARSLPAGGLITGRAICLPRAPLFAMVARRPGRRPVALGR